MKLIIREDKLGVAVVLLTPDGNPGCVVLSNTTEIKAKAFINKVQSKKYHPVAPGGMLRTLLSIEKQGIGMMARASTKTQAKKIADANMPDDLRRAGFSTRISWWSASSERPMGYWGYVYGR